MKIIIVGYAAATLLALSGCAMVNGPLMGSLYTDIKGPITATGQPSKGDRSGEACATSILGIIATGDASIETARKNAGVTKVTAVDMNGSSILGIYAKYCTVVYGSKSGKGGAAPADKGAPAEGGDL
ncbi:MAG: TRL-like family protein [Bdellovibrionales bacterium]|nr:TRL-like family protein [Bdellovibrionales bacterium]